MSRAPLPAEQPPSDGRRWGIVGAGAIAGRFVDAVAAAPGQVVAVSARDAGRAAAFARAKGIPRSYGEPADRLEQLLADGEVDAVYVATPHSHHHQPVLAALGAGIPVLCEKPLTHAQRMSQRCVEQAASTDTFLMEAMWTRFLPATRTAAAWIRAGDIGVPTHLVATMGFAATPDPTSRLFAPALAGGALLDIGVYPLALARWAFPQQDLSDIDLDWTPAQTGVDAEIRLTLTFSGGATAALTASLLRDQDGTATLHGSEGSIELPRFHKATEVRLRHGGAVVRDSQHPHEVNGLEHQVIAASAAIADGLIQHPLMPWTDTLAVADWSQQIRDRMGIRYPFEPAGS